MTESLQVMLVSEDEQDCEDMEALARTLSLSIRTFRDGEAALAYLQSCIAQAKPGENPIDYFPNIIYPDFSGVVYKFLEQQNLLQHFRYYTGEAPTPFKKAFDGRKARILEKKQEGENQGGLERIDALFS